MNTKNELTQEDVNELLKDKEILYLLQDLKTAKTFEDNIKITIYIKKGEIITYDMVEIDKTTTLYHLRQLQEKLFG